MYFLKYFNKFFLENNFVNIEIIKHNIKLYNIYIYSHLLYVKCIMILTYNNLRISHKKFVVKYL